MVLENIREALQEALQKLSISISEIHLEHPEDLSHGDYTTNVALVAAKKAKKNPQELAQEIVKVLTLPEAVESAQVAGAGFINFSLSRGYFSDLLGEILKQGDRWGSNDSLKGKRVVIDYTDPNLFKPLHIGHVMNNVLGEAVTRLFEISGAQVTRINYQADIGLHVAKALWGIRKAGADVSDIFAVGKAYVVGNEAYETDENAKKEIAVLNKALYEGSDTELMTLYAKGREASLQYFSKFYPILGTHFDADVFESETGPLGKTIVEEHIGSVFEKSDGAIVYHGEKYGLHTRVFITSQGMPTYEAKDIGLVAVKQKRFPFDLTISITSVEQADYFKVVIKAITDLYPDLLGKIEHHFHGFMLLTSGKMSSRKGNIVTGEELIETMREKARERVEGRTLGKDANKTADAVAIAAIKYAILKQSSGKNIVFDADKAFSLEGDSGPYLQYAHTRAHSVLEKAKNEGVIPDASALPGALTSLERFLAQFPDVVSRAVDEREPHYVTTYLTALAGLFNSYYAAEKILDGSPSAPYRLALAAACRQTLANGLQLLSIQAPERM